MPKPATDKPNVLPANLATIVAELKRLAARDNPAARTRERQQANNLAPAPLICGK